MPDHPGRSPVATAFALVGGLLFAASLAYAGVTFTTAWGVSGDADVGIPVLGAVGTDVALFSVFALHHSLFARLGLKAWVTRTFGADLERPIYVWCASVLFIATMWAWARVPGVAWAWAPTLAYVMVAMQVVGLVITLDASRQLGIFELAGIRTARGPADPSAPLRDDGYYGFVRHPIYFAWVLMVWCPPVMTGSRLTFAIVSTAYLVAAVPLEERALRRSFGARYDDYCQRVRWRMVPGVY